MNYKRIESELLQRLRQKESQIGLSRALGYKTNHVHKWESGRSHPTWKDFVAVCAVLKVDLSGAIRDLLTLHTQDNLKSVVLVRHLSCGLAPKEIAKKLKISQSMVSRWFAGAQIPSLIHILQLIDIGIYSLSAFIQRLLPDADIPLECLSYDEAAREINFKYPWAGALLRIFETRTYHASAHHDSAEIAAKLGLSRELVDVALAQFLEVGMIERDGDKFRTKEKRRITLDGAGRTAPIIRYWLKRTSTFIDKTEKSDGKNIAGYLVFSASDQTIQQLRAAYLEFYQKAQSIIHSEGADPADSVMLLNVQMVDVFGLPP